MACIIYRVDKKTGVKYAYRSESYRDPVTKKPKNRREYLGRVDPETNMIVPKGEPGTRNRSKLGNDAVDENVIPVETSELIARQRTEIQQLNQEVDSLKLQIKELHQSLKQLQSDLESITAKAQID